MYRVLYVDDEKDLLEIAKLLLEELQEFSIDTSTSAREVLKVRDLFMYDAIISDYQMPEMDGINFLKEVRSRFGDIPFILFTGKGREDVVIEAINNGADFYLQKGGHPKSQFAELMHKIRVAVGRRKAEKEVVNAGERYKAFISVSNTGAWEYHHDTGYLWCSPEYYSMLGRDASQFDLSGAPNLDATWINLLHPEDQRRAGHPR